MVGKEAESVSCTVSVNTEFVGFKSLAHASSGLLYEHLSIPFYGHVFGDRVVVLPRYSSLTPSPWSHLECEGPAHSKCTGIKVNSSFLPAVLL